MSEKILLTSFQTWLPHQPSNSSDELLIEVKALFPPTSLFLRQLPVDITKASERTIAAIEELQPEAIVCCGMAESRYRLSIESNATWTDDRLETSVNLEPLVAGLLNTTISHNAGKFVCEGLYYQVLRYLRSSQDRRCVFIHVPALTPTNLPSIVKDFQAIAEQLHR